MSTEEKKSYRDASVRGVPFYCGGHTIKAIPFDDLAGSDCCYQCEMDSECKGDILEMCEFVNGIKGYDEYTFQMIG